MILLDNIKAASLEARKARATAKATFLSTLLGEIETLAKSGTELTEAAVVGIIKKFIKNADEVLKLVDADSEAGAAAFREKIILEGFLPKQLTEDELTDLIDLAVASGASSVGDVMKLLKTSHNGLYDGALASKLIKARLA